MSAQAMQARSELSFGPFRLVAEERRLEKAGTELRIGGRAMDILLVLIEHAGAVVEKSLILDRVWKSVNVDDVSMRVHINALRKALGDGVDGARYIINVPGRGYSFVEQVRYSTQGNLQLTQIKPHPEPKNLPRRAWSMIGRAEITAEISDMLRNHRFVSILGPGGIGKTTIAIAVGHEMLEIFDGGVYFMDLGPISDPLLLPNLILSILAVTIYSENLVESLINFLHDKRLLLILDCCEHVVEQAAALAERIYSEAPRIHILVTSREMLSVEGERIYRLPPLELPPENDEISADSALAFPAVQLFVERAKLTSHAFQLNDADAPLVSEICRRLDGIALAIELAASRVDAYGVQAIAELLRTSVTLPWRGRRTAAARHQTLPATLDWSFNLLSETERIILCRISILVGRFKREAATAIALFGGITHEQILDSLACLVAKSLISAECSSEATHYRLLDTTRAYALLKLRDKDEAHTVFKRHAIHYGDVTKELVQRRIASPESSWKSEFAEHAPNVRIALDWCVTNHGNGDVAMALASASARLFLESALYTECHRWMVQVLAALDDTTRGTVHEVEIQTALGQSMMFTQGNKEDAEAAFERALELAEGLGHLDYQLQILTNLHLFHERLGNFEAAFEFARRSERIAITIGAPFGIAVASTVIGISCHLGGHHIEAMRHLESTRAHIPADRQLGSIYFGFDYSNRARITMGREFWIRGRPDQAVTAATSAVAQARQLDQPITLGIALIWAISVMVWSKNFTIAEDYAAQLKRLADKHSLGPYQPLAVGFAGEILVHRGDAEAGVALVRECLDALSLNRYGLMTTAFMTALAEGLLLVSRHVEALAMIESAISLGQCQGDLYLLPEMLRVKAMIVQRCPCSNVRNAEDLLLESISLAERQGALGWKLRAATSLSEMYFDHGQTDKSYATLAPVYQDFTEGFGTADLIAAKHLLDKL